MRSKTSKARPRPKTEPTQVRKRFQGPLIRMRKIVQALKDSCHESDGKFYSFGVRGIPKTVNSIWKIRADGRSHKDKRAKSFEEELLLRGRTVIKAPVKKGVFAILIAVESPGWIKQDGTVRETDIDNLMKSPIDGIKELIGGDHLVWDVHAFKVQSRREYTTVVIFELGDIIDQVESDPSDDGVL
jgi:Holliday junction resolvase RusA-like endonuclease